MANFGLSYPWIAKLNTATGEYSEAFKCGRAVSTTVTPNFNQASLFADDMQVEDVNEFKNATIALSVDTLPIKASEVLFGHTVSTEGVEKDKSSDSGVYVGYGFISSEMLDGAKKYRACLLLKAKFVESEEAYTTKGDSIAFTTPNLSGTAFAIGVGSDPEEWRRKSPRFDTMAEADAWLKEALNAD